MPAACSSARARWSARWWPSGPAGPVPPRSARRRADGGRDRHAAREPRRAARAAPHAAQERSRSRRLPDARGAAPACSSGGWSTRSCSARAFRRLPDLAELRSELPGIPVVAYAPFRPDDGELLLACRRHAVAGVAVEGVDDPIVGDMVMRASITAERAARAGGRTAHAPAHRAAPAGRLGRAGGRGRAAVPHRALSPGCSR